MVTARFARVVVLPSAALGDVTSSERSLRSSEANCRFIRSVRYDSAMGDAGSVSVIRS
jgi:hypothetical protein